MKKSTGDKRKFSTEQETKPFDVVTNNIPDKVGF